MANVIKNKRKTTSGAPAVGDLQDGEFCVVIPDQSLHLRIDSGTLVSIPSDAPSDGSTYGRNNGAWVVNEAAVGDMAILRLRSSAAQSADSTANIAVQWNQVGVKSNGFSHSTTVNNSRITVDDTGNYHLSGAIVYTGSTGNYRFTAEVSVRINGTTTLSSTFKGGYIRATSGANENQVPFTLALSLTAGDYVEILSKRINTTTGNATIEASSSVSMILLKGTKGDTGAAGADGADGTFDINGLTVENTIDPVNDTIGFYDSSAGTNRKTAIENIQGTAVHSGRVLVFFSAGSGTITHSLGFTPSVVILTLEAAPGATIFAGIMLQGKSSTTFTIFGREITEPTISNTQVNPLSGNYNVNWMAIP
jgi:hypothetical protein